MNRSNGKKLRGLRAVALLEGFKGLLALCVGLGVHALAGDRVRLVTESLVSHLHLNPAKHVPSILINAAGSITEKRIMLLAMGLLAYSLLRFIEAFGLWHRKVWTEWFALVSGAIYMPFEIYEMVIDASWLSFGALVINTVIVGYMAYVLYRPHWSAN